MNANTQFSLRSQIFLGVVFFVGIIFFILIKYQTPVYIKSLYQHQNYPQLNKLTLSKDTQSLDFYLGRAEDVLWGPAAQLISGFIFLIFCLRFLRESNCLIFVLGIVLYFCLTRPEILFFPPYGDAIGGPFAEGLWLADNHFDYAGLFHQPGYAEGGPRVYLFSIFPTYLAILLKLIPSTRLFLAVGHIGTFIMAALTIAVLRDIAARCFSQDIAILFALSVLFMPLFQSQSEAINMEIPSLVFMMLAADAIVKKKIHLAGIMAIAAVLVKGTGVLVCIAVALINLILFAGDNELRFRKRLVFWTVFLILFAWGNLSLKYFTHDQHVSAGMVNLFKGWPSFQHTKMLVIFLLAFFVFAGCAVYKSLINHSDKNFDVLKQFWEALVMFIFGGMWFALFLNFFAVSPRYRVAVYPFLFFCVFYVLALFIKSNAIRKWGLIVVGAVGLIISYGFYDGLSGERSQVILEKSLEYRNDLRVNQKLAKLIENNFSQFTIGAPFTIAQMLAIPRLGYVDKKLNVMIYGFRCYYGGIKNYEGIDHLDIRHTVYVSKLDDEQPGQGFPIAPQDKVINILEYGNKRAWIFVGGFGIDRLWRSILFRQFENSLRKK